MITAIPNFIPTTIPIYFIRGSGCKSITNESCNPCLCREHWCKTGCQMNGGWEGNASYLPHAIHSYTEHPDKKWTSNKNKLLLYWIYLRKQNYILMGLCKKDVTPFLMHRIYVFLALTHRYLDFLWFPWSAILQWLQILHRVWQIHVDPTYSIGIPRGYAIQSGRRPEGSQRPQGRPQFRPGRWIPEGRLPHRIA